MREQVLAEIDRMKAEGYAHAVAQVKEMIRADWRVGENTALHAAVDALPDETRLAALGAGVLAKVRDLIVRCETNFHALRVIDMINHQFPSGGA